MGKRTSRNAYQPISRRNRDSCNSLNSTLWNRSQGPAYRTLAYRPSLPVALFCTTQLGVLSVSAIFRQLPIAAHWDFFADDGNSLSETPAVSP
jgi:hypothetical protein